MKLQVFKTDKLNEIGQLIIEQDNKYQSLLNMAERNITSAFETRWEQGKLIYENLDYIKAECGSQKNFAESINKSESIISNNKRAYETLLEDYGCETWDEVVGLLKEKNILMNSRNFEKIGTLLNEPEKDTTQKEQIDKDRRRLEQLHAEAQEILKRIEPANKPELYDDAFELKEDLENIQEYIDSLDLERFNFKSEKYLDFVRNFGIDLITMEPCERCDPHHTNPRGGSGSMGSKLPDFFTIPVSRKTHLLIEGGFLVPSEKEILNALFTTVATFIAVNFK